MSLSQSFRCRSVVQLLVASLLYQLTNLASSFVLSPRTDIHQRHGIFERSDSLTSTSSSSFEPMIQRAKIAFDNFDREGKGLIDKNGLDDLLAYLNLDATPEERKALFLYLDMDRDGSIGLAEFINWYYNAAEAETKCSRSFQGMLTSRRTVNSFDTTPVSDEVLRRAVECAIAAPNRSQSEPWRFVKIGSETVAKLQKLNDEMMVLHRGRQQLPPLLPEIWAEIPGWCVVTTKLSADGDVETELKDFRSTSCAMQNFMLSMWSEGVGSKWTEGPMQKTQQFADIVGIDTSLEKVVGIIWYGFTTGGLTNADPKQQRRKGVNEVLTYLR